MCKQRIINRFLKEIEKKNSWGKQELKLLLLGIMADFFDDYMTKGESDD